MARNPVILVHGYSDQGQSFKTWRTTLKNKGYQAEEISVCSYESLTNEITIKDVAEGFDRALRISANIKEDQPFDAIVHSTGMLVVRSWLTSYAKRRKRLNHLIGIAPASFGSPLAKQGRSVLGAIFKGSKHLGPDFLEAGDQILDGLELASRFTWDLAHLDLLPYDPVYNPYPEDKTTDRTFYGKDESTPYVFIFCGTKPYGGLRKVVNQPGTDGTVRWAGCSLRTRKITLDLTRDRNEGGNGTADGKRRINVLRGTNIPIPVVPVAGLTHGSIIQEPSPELIDMVLEALNVSSEAEFFDWHARRGATEANAYSYASKWGDEGGLWAQFVIHAVDERNDPIPDYHLEFFADDGNDPMEIDMDVYPYSSDKSYRCYHVDLKQINNGQITADLLNKLHVRIIAKSGTDLVTYHGLGSERTATGGGEDGKWDAVLDFSGLPDEAQSQAEFFFRPFSTTLIELVMNREPLPLDAAQRNKVCYWEDFDD